ncbi:GAF domain-containing sensor histidine kinase [Leptospira semungkisensis]|uniref:GAF domain-containing sensor histidine kinase n=1 Tax=Leptospira semungkisensis TaxID=2484985 RepID=A0A4R9FMA4_9LEPT|nr:GAF domain-containing sensor histidine kinase [Leptospira semungkisensis]TGJ99492.1 GAF domain-containing sensor histidine kinase [Leptospira semungkisensis]
MHSISNIDTNAELESISKIVSSSSLDSSLGSEGDKREIEEKDTQEELLRKISILNLLQQVASSANEANDVESILQFSIDRICAIGNWKLGQVYLLSDEGRSLHLSSICYCEEDAFLKKFRSELSKGRSLFADKVCRERKPIWSAKISNHLKGDLSSLSIQAAIESSFALPVLVRENLVCVLEFFSEFEIPDPSFLEAITHISSLIGRVFERREAENSLKNSQDQLRALSARLQEVREEERLLVAREIHDELGQLLTVLKIDITLLKNNIQKKVPEAVDLFSDIKSMIKVADTAIESVQRIATELRPMILEDLGLIEGIEWYSKDFQKRTGLVCELSVKAENLPGDKEYSIALFRIFQEALTNIARHADASRILISLEEEAHFLILRIEDNGVGISQTQLKDHKSLGLVGMRERAIVLGGELTVLGQKGKGTSVVVKIPLRNELMEEKQ